MILSRERQLLNLGEMLAGSAQSNPIFIVSYGAGHAAALAPVAVALVRDGFAVVCLGLTTAPAVFARHGIEALGVRDLAGFSASYRDAHRLGQRLMPAADRHALVDHVESDTYMGIGFLAMVRARGLRAARADYAVRARQSFCPTEFFEEIFSVLKPGVVVATSAPRSERAALEAARALGIKRLCLVDLYAPFEVEWCASPGFADRICVLSDAVAAHMQAHGVPAEKVRVTGNPSFDRLGQVDRLELRKKFRTEHAIPEDARVVAWISQPEPRKHPFCDLVGDPQMPVKVEDALAAHFAHSPDVRIVIRMHPSETREKRFLGNHVSYSDTLQSLDELLSGVDCVLTSGSTVGLEAAMLGTPVGQYTGSIFSNGLPLATMGLAEPVDALSDLGRTVEKLFATKHGANPKVLALRRQVGSAAKNVASEIDVLYFNSER
jgi:hypothetical protein